MSSVKPLQQPNEPTATGAKPPAAFRLCSLDETQTLNVEPRRARALFRALMLAEDNEGTRALLEFSGRPQRDSDAREINDADCKALAERLRRFGYPLSNDGISRFKLERGLAAGVRIGPDVAAAYVSLARGRDARIDLRGGNWSKIDEETRRALQLLLLINRKGEDLASVFRALGLPEPIKDSNGTVVVSQRAARQLMQWARSFGFAFTNKGLRHLGETLERPAPAVDGRLARFVAHGVLSRGEPPADYRRVEVDGHQLNRRTQVMIENAERMLAGRARFRITKGSYEHTDERGAHPHQGGGVVDLEVLAEGSEQIEPAVFALRRAGFAAWYRAEREQPHVHAVAIGDHELSPSATWQVRAYFRGRDGRTRSAPDPHSRLPATLPDWLDKYKVRHF